MYPSFILKIQPVISKPAKLIVVFYNTNRRSKSSHWDRLPGSSVVVKGSDAGNPTSVPAFFYSVFLLERTSPLKIDPSFSNVHKQQAAKP
jgi:hypothetical protein